MILIALLLVACASKMEESRLKIVAVNTTNRVVYAVYATDKQAEIRKADIVSFFVDDAEIFTELQNNIGGLYNVTVKWDGLEARIIKAVKV